MLAFTPKALQSCLSAPKGTNWAAKGKQTCGSRPTPSPYVDCSCTPPPGRGSRQNSRCSDKGEFGAKVPWRSTTAPCVKEEGSGEPASRVPPEVLVDPITEDDPLPVVRVLPVGNAPTHTLTLPEGTCHRNRDCPVQGFPGASPGLGGAQRSLFQSGAKRFLSRGKKLKPAGGTTLF